MTLIQALINCIDEYYKNELADRDAMIADLQDTVTSLRHVLAEQRGKCEALRKENARFYRREEND